MFDLGPLHDGDTVAIIGGGPGGTSCAITLAREAARRNLKLHVVLFEGKRFGSHFNQCAGVLSPPITSLLKDLLDVTLPPSLVQREISGYVLHSGNDALALRHGCSDPDVSLAVRRVEFDRFMMDLVREHGVEHVDSRVTDIEFLENEVVIYSWSGTRRAKAVVGAFGLARAMCDTFAGRTAYQAPPWLEAVVSKVHPAGRVEMIADLLDNHIQVFLPDMPGVEFAALIPKGNHVTTIVAGRRVTTREVEKFMAMPQVRSLLHCNPEPEDFFKGTFPVGLAHNPFGDRYVTVGDSAGLVRPFKGKGINSAIITGNLAARTMLEYGVGRQAFGKFWSGCSDFVRDVAYGKLVRHAANLISHRFSLTPVISLAREDPTFRQVLYDCVSGRETYRNIVRRSGSWQSALRLIPRFLFSKVTSDASPNRGV